MLLGIIVAMAVAAVGYVILDLITDHIVKDDWKDFE